MREAEGDSKHPEPNPPYKLLDGEELLGVYPTIEAAETGARLYNEWLEGERIRKEKVCAQYTCSAARAKENRENNS